MKLISRLVLFLVTGVVVLGIVISGAGWFYLSSRLPKIDGTLVTEKITEGAEITRDRWGVPHIKAGNGKDAYFALGYSTAQDRLFQMELQRRLAKGELAEILGPKLLPVDKMFRTLMLKRQGEAYLSNETLISRDARVFLDSFLEGINHFIATGPLPVEYSILGFKPAPFTRVDTVSLLGYVAYSFADAIKRDSLYTILEAHLTEEDLKMVFPEYTLENRVTIMEPQGLPLAHELKSGKDLPEISFKEEVQSAGKSQSFAGLTPAFQEITARAEKIIPPFIGSNSWVLSPSRSKNGHAILANDPHIGIANPGVWYEAHLKYPGYENYGYHLPLMPFPMLAHNRDKAWAITMFENDDMDLYSQTFHPDNPSLVKFKGEWTKIKTIEETIKIKDAPDESLTIRITPQGPVITDFIKGYSGGPVALSWVYLQVENPVLDIVLDMARAKDMESFRKALVPLAAPGLNISYADSSGNIAWWAAGRIPVRPAGVTGKKIHDGSSGDEDWLGLLPFEKNPHMVNPENGLIITANNLSSHTPIDPIGVLTGYFRPSDRAARIYELLVKNEKWSVEDLKLVQTDSRLHAGEQITSGILNILEPRKNELSPAELNALTLLSHWDGYMETDSIGGTVFQFSVYHILKQALEPDIGPENLKAYLNLVDHWDFLKLLLKKDASPIRGTDASIPVQERDGIVLEGFRNAVAEMQNRLGTNEKSWAWGNVHKVEYVHALGRQKPLNHIFNVGPFKSPAEATSVNKLKSKRGNHDFKVSSLPSTRRLIDLNNPEGSWSIIPTGNSGNFMSPFYDDQAKLYIQNQYRQILFTENQIKEMGSHSLTLVPES